MMKITAFLILLTLVLGGCATAPYHPALPPLPAGIYHIVGSGQTLYRISKAYGVDLNELMRVNNIKDPDQLGVGEKLFIPGANYPFSFAPYKPGSFGPIPSFPKGTGAGNIFAVSV